MADSYRVLRTKFARALDLVGGDGLPAALAAVADPFKDALARFQAAEKAARDAAIAWGKEAPEADAAMKTLAGSYDAAREATIARVPGMPDPGPSSSHTTPTETLEAAVALADVLADRDEAWAKPLLDDLGPKLEAADKEVDEKVEAGALRQKADELRATTAAAAREAFLHVRRVVRRVHGPRSREYHSLRDRNVGGVAGEASGTGAGAGASGDAVA